MSRPQIDRPPVQQVSRRAAVLAVAIIGFSPITSNAQTFDDPPPLMRSTYGDVGLFDMPSARMAPDGQLAFTAAAVASSERFTLSFEALPWLEASFRYARVGHWGTNAHYYDRSFGLKVHLLEEQGWLPAIAVGARDFVGSGGYGGEYVVGSKQFGPFDLTAGLGWGRLGQTMVLPNPIGYLSNSFDNRIPPNNEAAGVLGFKTLFHGKDIGVFGGLAWQTPIEGLSFLSEYSSDKYYDERISGGLKIRSPVNVGLSYHAGDAVTVSAGWLYGTTYGLTLALSGDPTTSYPSAVRIGPELPAPAVRTDTQKKNALSDLQQQRHAAGKRGDAWVNIPTNSERLRYELLQNFYSDTRTVRDVQIDGHSLMIDAKLESDPEKQCSSYARIAMANPAGINWVALSDLQNPNGSVVICQMQKAAFASASPTSSELASDIETGFESKFKAAMKEQGLLFSGMQVGTSELTVYYENYRYNRSSEAAGRIARLLMVMAPPSVEIFHLVQVGIGVPLQEVTILRSGLERMVGDKSWPSMAGKAISYSPAPMHNPVLDQYAPSNYPSFNMSLDPKLTQHLFDPDAPIQFMLYGDFAALLQLMPGLAIQTELTGTVWSNYTFNRDAGSELPHVRSDILKYLNQGKYGISVLSALYRARLTPTVFTEVRAGYLEDMFVGAGGQVLWRPEESRLAIGADFYDVWQRDFNRLFGVQRYHVFTGHVSVYYRSPWHDLNFAVHAGQYLAGDRGATIEISRRFSTGVEIGAWATFTNVPYNKFGEGSFDKGISIHIPFEWGLPIWSQSSYDLRLSPLTRDGGQRLAGDDSLYAATESTTFGQFVEHLDDVVAP